MKAIDKNAAAEYLSSVGMEISSWNGLAYKNAKPQFEVYRAPRDSRSLWVFSQCVVDWLPPGEWRILQIDNSTSPDATESILINRLLGISTESFNSTQITGATYFFEFKDDKVKNIETQLLISSIIFLFLLFELHCYFVSSGSEKGQFLGVADGCIELCSREQDLSRAREILKSFEKNPSKSPDWALDVIARNQ